MWKEKLQFTAVAALMTLPVTAWASESPGSVQEAFQMGTIAGQVAIYGQHKNQEQVGANDEGFISGSAAIVYETAPLYGVNLGLGVWGSTKLDERNDDYQAAIRNNDIIHQAFVRYQRTDFGQLTIGRQEIDLEWLTDYVQGLVATSAALPDLDLTLGWVERQAKVDIDEVDRRFERMNGTRGLYFLDVKYSPLEWLEINPYYYHAPDLFKAPGLKARVSFDVSNGLQSVSSAQFARASADQAGERDGDIVWLNQDFSYQGARLNGGYIKIDQDGLGGLDSFGDQQPLEEGNYVLAADGRTWYLGAGYTIAGFDLGLLYSQTRYLDENNVRLKEKELSLTAEYEIVTNLSLGLTYVDVDHDRVEESYQMVKSNLLYRF